MENLGLWISLGSTLILMIGGIFVARAVRSLGVRLREAVEEKIEAQTKVNYFQDQALKYEEASGQLSRARERIAELNESLSQERQRSQEKVEAFEEARGRLEESFKALSSEALSRNNQTFLDLARSTLEKAQTQAKGDWSLHTKSFGEMVTPVREALTGVDKRLGDLEKARLGAYEALKQQVGDLVTSQKELRSETSNLVKALRSPNVRGRWGEMQLKRVVEMSGLSAHCDFVEQPTIEGKDDAKLRPDMIVNLPGDKQIIIDSKAPLSAYLDALDAKSEEERRHHMTRHAQHVRSHITLLSQKSYWSQLDLKETPEFVILFLPGETFFTAALEQEPDLIEMGVQKKVILATPATLIALLHAVAYGWRQESLAENARKISDLGQELYKRLSDMAGYLSKLGGDITTCANTYNKLVGNLERRVLPSARRFEDLQVSHQKDELPEVRSVATDIRAPQSPELLPEKASA
ncbi:MAG: DNA recombination protein RmuC [bacterium]|nr:DNA recombination protein RmuC [bacterium]